MMAFVEKSMTETNDTGGTAARAVDRAQTSAHRAIDRASDAARPAVGRFAAGAHRAVDNVAGAANQTAQALDAKSGQVRDAHSWVSESCRMYVRDKPFTSLGIAVATGFLLSWSLTRR